MSEFELSIFDDDVIDVTRYDARHHVLLMGADQFGYSAFPFVHLIETDVAVRLPFACDILASPTFRFLHIAYKQFVQFVKFVFEKLLLNLLFSYPLVYLFYAWYMV